MSWQPATAGADSGSQPTLRVPDPRRLRSACSRRSTLPERVSAAWPPWRCFGYPSREDLLATPLSSVYNPTAALVSGPREPRDGPIEIRLLTRGGTPIEARVQYEATRSAAGEITEYHGVVEDLTEQRDAELEAARSGQRLASFFDNENVGMSVVDLDMRLIDVKSSTVPDAWV